METWTHSSKHAMWLGRAKNCSLAISLISTTQGVREADSNHPLWAVVRTAPCFFYFEKIWSLSLKLLDCILDYQEKFDGKTCQVSTNYKHLETFEVDFCLTDLHHLFGLHKITRDYASQTIPAIQAGVFILEEYKNNPMYNDVI